MDDPTADEFVEAMQILKKYTLNSQISLEGECLIACIMNSIEVTNHDEEKLTSLGWELIRRDDKAEYFRRPFADH
jgi:hypothetical protein